MELLAAVFAAGVIFGALSMHFINRANKVGDLFLVEDKGEPGVPYIFLELDDRAKIEKIRKSKSVIFDVDKTGRDPSQ